MPLLPNKSKTASKLMHPHLPIIKNGKSGFSGILETDKKVFMYIVTAKRKLIG
jgi:hypothetical protein